MNKEPPKYLVTKELQFVIRVIYVFISVLLTARWYRRYYPEKKNIFWLIIIALIIGLYFDNV